MKLKIKQLNELDLSEQEYEDKHSRIIEKACLCMGLGSSSLKEHGTDINDITTICPGPNLAYFSAITSLKNMVGSIYGKASSTVKVCDNRPNVFIKELSIYINYLKDKIIDQSFPINRKDEKYYKSFVNNINNGIQYYKELFSNMKSGFENSKENILIELDKYSDMINSISLPKVKALEAELAQ